MLLLVALLGVLLGVLLLGVLLLVVVLLLGVIAEGGCGLSGGTAPAARAATGSSGRPGMGTRLAGDESVVGSASKLIIILISEVGRGGEFPSLKLLRDLI